MRPSIVLVIILFTTCCSTPERETDKILSSYTFAEDEWTVFEGKWKTSDGILRIELSLKNAPPDMESDFILSEMLARPNSHSSGTVSRGRYSIIYGLDGGKTGIHLIKILPNATSRHFKQQRSWFFDSTEEMFFVSLGDDEIIPSDSKFVPLAEANSISLAKRLSKLRTVEGYITFRADSAEFFERNTREQWNLSQHGEFDSLRAIYYSHPREKFEGVYLKALAFMTSGDQKSRRAETLVVKRILTVGNDPG